jgi:hypothetical protein
VRNNVACWASVLDHELRRTGLGGGPMLPGARTSRTDEYDCGHWNEEEESHQ